jgi:hypothetical protein
MSSEPSTTLGSMGYKRWLPARQEVLTNTMTNSPEKLIDVPFLSTNPRQYIKDELGFTLWEPLSLTITHEYGDIPPASISGSQGDKWYYVVFTAEPTHDIWSD